MCPAVQTPPHDSAAGTTLSQQSVPHTRFQRDRHQFQSYERRGSFFISFFKRGNKYTIQGFSPIVCTSVRNILQNLLRPQIMGQSCSHPDVVLSC